MGILAVGLGTALASAYVRASSRGTLDDAVAVTGLVGASRELVVLVVAVLLGLPGVVTGLGVYHWATLDRDTTRHRLRMIAVGLVAALGGAAAFLAPVARYPEALPAVVGLGTLVGHALLPHLRRRQLRTRAPTDEERAAIDPSLAETGFDPDRVSIVEGDDDRLWRPWIDGVGRFGHLFVPERCFDRYDEAVLDAVLVRLAVYGRADRFRTACWSVWAGLLTAVYVASDAADIAWLVSAALVLLAPVAFVAVGRRRTYRGDERAAAITGTGRMIEALRAQADAFGTESRLSLLVRMAPPVDSRIERLERLHEREAAAADADRASA